MFGATCRVVTVYTTATTITTTTSITIVTIILLHYNTYLYFYYNGTTASSVLSVENRCLLRTLPGVPPHPRSTEKSPRLQQRNCDLEVSPRPRVPYHDCKCTMWRTKHQNTFHNPTDRQRGGATPNVLVFPSTPSAAFRAVRCNKYGTFTANGWATSALGRPSQLAFRKQSSPAARFTSTFVLPPLPTCHCRFIAS